MPDLHIFRMEIENPAPNAKICAILPKFALLCAQFGAYFGNIDAVPNRYRHCYDVNVTSLCSSLPAKIFPAHIAPSESLKCHESRGATYGTSTVWKFYAYPVSNITAWAKSRITSLVIASVLERTPRGEACSAGEDLALARAWISITNEIDDKRQVEFWNEVARTYNTEPETEGTQVRSSKSMRSRFNVLQGNAQKYISADKIYRATPRSGETEEDVPT
jgi:hypothetical protein